MKHIVSAAFFVVILGIGLLGLNRWMRRDDGEAKYREFFVQDQDIDVFFLGTSHVMDAIYPNVIWKDYGFTCYNLGNTAETMEATYWTLRLAQQFHTPKVAMIDVCYMDREQGNAQEYNHMFLDEIPLNRLKLEAIWSIFPEGSRAEFVFPLVLYHNRWSEIMFGEKEEMTNCPTYMYGAELRMGRAVPAEFKRTNQALQTNNKGREALRQAIEFCIEKDIKPVLIAIPYPAEEMAQISMNGAIYIAQEYGIPFLNLFDVEGLVDFQTDCYDESSHLNPDGAVKVTNWIGKWLLENGGLTDRRGDDRYAAWNEAYTQYQHDFEEYWGAQSLL